MWHFAHHLHTPPPAYDAMTVEDTDRGIEYLRQLLRAGELPEDD